MTPPIMRIISDLYLRSHLTPEYRVMEDEK
jgi:hypothetical protein